MSDQLIPFDVDGANMRFGRDEDGRPYVVAADFAKRLGHRDAADAVRLLEEDEKGTQIVRTPGGDQRMAVLYEDGIWELIFLSRRPEARNIKKRVKAILRELRETGRAVTQISRRELAEMVIAEADRADRAEATVIELRPKAESWDVLADTGADYSAREAAYILNRDPAISTGQNRLLALLRSWRLIDRNDKPYANHSTHVTLRPQTRVAPDGERVQAKPQVRITVAGLSYLHKKLGGVEPLDFSEEAS